jgi:Relaxase/Mobilisation nuclease domain
MIAKGNLHANGGKLAAYMTTAKDGERVELAELRGCVADNIFDAFNDVEIQAEATRCEKPFFHAYVRCPAHEHLTKDQWMEAADRFEQGLGFSGQPRAVAFHYKADGWTHMHIAWSRIDLETMKAIDPGLYKNKLKAISRELEVKFGLTIVRNERDPEQKTRAPSRNEFEQSRRLDTDLIAIRETIRDCWDRSDNGRAFEAALEEKGLILARGDRRDFVIVDHEGGIQSLSKRITGATAAQTRTRMADVDRDQLLSIREARAALREARQADRATEKQRTRPPSEVEIKVFTAHKGNANDKAFVAELADKGLTLARATAPDLIALDAIGKAMAAHDHRHGMRYAPPAVGLGEMVAVNRWGGVHRLDPGRIPLQEIEQRLARAKLKPPSIVEARAFYEIPREKGPAIDRAATGIDVEMRRTPQMTAPRRGIGSAARGAGKALDGAAKVAGSILDAIGNAFAPSPDASPRSQEKETQPVATAEPIQQTPHAEAVRNEEQARAQRMQELVDKYGRPPSPEMERDAELGLPHDLFKIVR